MPCYRHTKNKGEEEMTDAFSATAMLRRKKGSQSLLLNKHYTTKTMAFSAIAANNTDIHAHNYTQLPVKE